MYRTLHADKIVETAATLRRRIEERFPEAGLAKVAAELHQIAGEAVERCLSIRRPNYLLRGLAYGGLTVGLVALAWSFTHVEVGPNVWALENFLEELEATLGSLFFLAAIATFLVTIEVRVKRNRALRAIQELRALAHIVDMHQLTKDPERILWAGPSTESSPQRTMTPFELGRYFDYCSEMLSLVSKLGALYVQEFPDQGALVAVDELETLTTGLSAKIWQKIMILDRYLDESEGAATDPVAPALTSPES
ncbi:MAG: hypothetical protein AB7O52_03840 [Planctomycetota bacterium]